MWKYSAHNGVTGTPSLFVNGVQVQEPPFDADDYMKLLTDVYNAQISSQGFTEQEPESQE